MISRLLHLQEVICSLELLVFSAFANLNGVRDSSGAAEQICGTLCKIKVIFIAPFEICCLGLFLHSVKPWGHTNVPYTHTNTYNDEETSQEKSIY